MASSSSASESSHRKQFPHWEKALDLIANLQRKGLLPLPRGDDAETVVGGCMELEAQHVALACMNGDMGASSWALFDIREPAIVFSPEAKFVFAGPSRELAVDLHQLLHIRLGTPVMREDSECKAIVARIQVYRHVVSMCQGRSKSVPTSSGSVDEILAYIIEDVLHLMTPGGAQTSAFRHNVLELFRFPPLEADLATMQKQTCDEDEPSDEAPEVDSQTSVYSRWRILSFATLAGLSRCRQTSVLRSASCQSS